MKRYCPHWRLLALAKADPAGPWGGRGGRALTDPSFHLLTPPPSVLPLLFTQQLLRVLGRKSRTRSVQTLRVLHTLSSLHQHSPPSPPFCSCLSGSDFSDPCEGFFFSTCLLSPRLSRVLSLGLFFFFCLALYFSGAKYPWAIYYVFLDDSPIHAFSPELSKVVKYPIVLKCWPMVCCWCETKFSLAYTVESASHAGSSHISKKTQITVSQIILGHLPGRYHTED